MRWNAPRGCASPGYSLGAFFSLWLLPVVLLWLGEVPPRANLVTEIWQRTPDDTTWTLRSVQIPDLNGLVGDEVEGPRYVKARWRWDIYKIFLEPGATTVPPAPQSLYGPWSPLHFVPKEQNPGRTLPPIKLRVP